MSIERCPECGVERQQNPNLRSHADWCELGKALKAESDKAVANHRLTQLEEKATLFDTLRALMGYVQNGTGQTVRIFQDDATNTYHVSAGDKTYWGESLKIAIGKAAADHKE